MISKVRVAVSCEKISRNLTVHSTVASNAKCRRENILSFLVGCCYPVVNNVYNCRRTLAPATLCIVSGMGAA